MKNFWDLNNIEKKEYIERILNERKPVNSLSNDVFVFENIIIKKKEDINDVKSKNEINFLSMNNFNYEVLDNYLILEKIHGENLTQENINNDLMSKIVKAINNFRKMNDHNITEYRLIERLKKSENEILSKLELFNIDSSFYYRSIELANNEQENVLSHSDLNDNNILINESEVILIDFEEVAIGNKYHDATSFISNWDIPSKYIIDISELLNLDWSNVVDLSLIWAVRYYIWNEKQYFKTGNSKYKSKMEFFEKRMKSLSELK